MDDLLSRIDELLGEDPRTAKVLADDILATICDEALSVAARAVCVWGGVRRLHTDWVAADKAYRLAKQLLNFAEASPEDWFDWHSRMAFLRRDQRQLSAAEAHAEDALRLSRELDDPVRLSHALVDLGLVVRHVDLERARQYALEALALLPDDDRAYRRAALHVVLSSLCYADDPDLEALEVWLEKVRRMDDAPSSYAGLRLRWFEGLAARRQGRPAEAVELLEGVYQGLLEYESYAYAANCALDLAQAHLDAGNGDATADLAGTLFPVLGALRHDQEALSALRIFCRAAEQRTLNAEVLAEVRRRLEGTA
jgi:hypothetical protein